MRKYTYIFTAIVLLGMVSIHAQEETPFIAYDVPAQNLLKFNRFLLNPTFSTVREDKSYINLFHRNQSASFDDNNQTYFLSYSGRIGDRSGVGISLYTQRQGLFDNFGLLANYAYGIRLSEKSNFTFGANFSYYNSGFNLNRATPVDIDPSLNGLDDSALITFQPGFNLSFGAFDFGAFAENLFDYNLKTSASVTEFNEKTYTGHLQYTHQFKNSAGLLEQGRLMPLARVSNVRGEDIVLGGSLILDLPKLGWLQAGYDDFYGASAGIGFNLNKRISLGYTMEKSLNNEFVDLGVNHEISLAYSFTPNLTEDRVLLEKENEDLVDNSEGDTPIEELSLTDKDLKIAALERKLAENDAVLDELLLRQDSLEKSRERDLERRFQTVMRLVKRNKAMDYNSLEKQAKDIFYTGSDSTLMASAGTNTPVANHGLSNTTASKRAIQLNIKKKKLGPSSVAKQRGSAVTRTSSPKDVLRQRTASYAAKSFSIPNVSTGHYLIANVYKGTQHMNRFIEKLQQQGIQADYFKNPRNGLNYVYLKGYASKKEAIAAYRTGLDGAYSDETWVMSVKGQIDNTSYDGIAQKSNYDNSVLQKNVVDHGSKATHKGKVDYTTITAKGLGSGFYIIANVFADAGNANRFVRKLNAQGLNASYFINPENNYRYVYLKKHDNWATALSTYYSKLNNTYDDNIWIMRVKPS